MFAVLLASELLLTAYIKLHNQTIRACYFCSSVLNVFFCQDL